MATLLPSLSSDDENNDGLISGDERDAHESGDISKDFTFGGILVRPFCVVSLERFMRLMDRIILC